MLRFAIKMLFGDNAKFYGILLGLGFASLPIAQQASIFVGLMSRTFAFVGEVGHIGRERQSRHGRVALVLGHLPRRQTAIERGHEPGTPRLGRLGRGLAHHDVETGPGADLGDARAHQAAADDSDSFDRGRR